MERPTRDAPPESAPPPRSGEAPAAPRRRPGFGGGPRRVARTEGEEGGTFDVRNSWQVVAGSILIPLGLIIILIAWYGAAHARVVQQQIPYMVSGGFIGLGAMIVGGLLFWGHWLYRMYDQAELHHEEQLRALGELTRALTGVAGSGVSNGAVGVGGPAEPPRAGSYLATANGSVYHLAGCPVIAHHPNELRVLGPAGLGGLRPCQICSPG